MRVPSSFLLLLLLPSSVGKESQLLLKPTEVELGLQVGVEFDNVKLPLSVLSKCNIQVSLKK